jgi:hypothetical protein
MRWSGPGKVAGGAPQARGEILRLRRAATVSCGPLNADVSWLRSMGAIAEVLFPLLKESFPGRSLRLDFAPSVCAVFPAAHPEVGDLIISDDGNEATVTIGSITHCHFNPYDESLSPEQLAKRVSNDVIAFLRELFADRVLIWRSGRLGSGGWQRLPAEKPAHFLSEKATTYLWSGPTPNPLLNTEAS